MASNSVGNSAPSAAATVTPYSLTANRGGIDPNGDGKGKILVRVLSGANSGQLQLANFNTTTNKLIFTNIPDPGANQRILGVGDLSGNHKSDLLYQNATTGDVNLWRDFDGFIDNQFFLRTVKPGWVVEAVADIDGDGKSDIVWRFTGSPLNPAANPDDIGVVFIWYMDGSSISEIKARGGAPAAWNLVGASDLHGNGRADLVWVSPANVIRCITALSNRSHVNELVGNVPTGYTLVRLGDFNGDGKADLLFRNAGGKIKVWLMDGTTISSQIDLPDSDASWELFAAEDLNGDGVIDLVFKKPDGTLVVWLMKAATPTTPTVIDNAGTLPSGAVNIDP